MYFKVQSRINGHCCARCVHSTNRGALGEETTAQVHTHIHFANANADDHLSYLFPSIAQTLSLATLFISRERRAHAEVLKPRGLFNEALRRMGLGARAHTVCEDVNCDRGMRMSATLCIRLLYDYRFEVDIIIFYALFLLYSYGRTVIKNHA